MSRTKSTGLIKRAVRGTSDAGRAGWRPKVDMAESARINGLRPAAAPAVERKAPALKPIYDEVFEAGAAKIEALAEPANVYRCSRCGRLDELNENPGDRAEDCPGCAAPVTVTAAEAREIHEDRERTERLDPQPPRRMTQPGLFDGIGVKV